MTNEHDQNMESIGEMEGSSNRTGSSIDRILTVATESAGDGRLAMLGGGTILLSTLRSIGRGQWRAVPKAAVGAGLLGIGLRQHRSSESSTFEPSTDEIEGETEGKPESDDAHAAREGPDTGREPQLEGEDRADEGSRVEFSDDADVSEPRSKPGLEGDSRHDNDDESVTIDVSDAAMADEAGEATGPTSEQAQPTQTDATEPEETPEEDASDMKVEPDEDAGDEPEDEEDSANEADADDET